MPEADVSDIEAEHNRSFGAFARRNGFSLRICEKFQLEASNYSDGNNSSLQGVSRVEFLESSRSDASLPQVFKLTCSL